MGAIVPTFVAAITGTTVFTHFMGSQPVLPTPGFALGNPLEIIVVLLLGPLAGLAGLAYTRGLSFIEDTFDGWRVPFWVKNLSGGLTVGIIGLYLPQVLGVGYDTMQEAVRGHLPLYLLLLLLAAKYAATLFTIGAGGSGGVFAPSLYLGTMTGGIYGLAAHTVLPGVVSNPLLYTVVGMGAIFAGSAQAPLTASTIILEMTGDYRITIGVMGACALSYLIHGSLSRDSMYTTKLSRRGLVILRGTDIRPTQRIPVTSAMSPSYLGTSPQTSIVEAQRLLTQADTDILVVEDLEGKMVGVVASSDLRKALVPGKNKEQEKGGTVGRVMQTVGRVMQTRVISIFSSANLEDAIRLFGFYDIKTLLVVDPNDSRRVVGLLRQSDVFRAYSAHTIYSMEAASKVHLLQEKTRDQGAFRQVFLESTSSLAWHRLADLHLPEECVLVAVIRNQHLIVPHGDTILQPGDSVLLFAAPAHQLERVCRQFQTTKARAGTP